MGGGRGTGCILMKHQGRGLDTATNVVAGYGYESSTTVPYTHNAHDVCPPSLGLPAAKLFGWLLTPACSRLGYVRKSFDVPPISHRAHLLVRQLTAVGLNCTTIN